MLRVLARKADGIRAFPRFSLKSDQWPTMFRAMGILLVGAVINISGPLDQYFLAHSGDGAIATLGYATRLLSLLISMGALAISRATLPIISEVLVRGDHVRAQHGSEVVVHHARGRRDRRVHRIRPCALCDRLAVSARCIHERRHHCGGPYVPRGSAADSLYVRAMGAGAIVRE